PSTVSRARGCSTLGGGGRSISWRVGGAGVWPMAGAAEQATLATRPARIARIAILLPDPVGERSRITERTPFNPWPGATIGRKAKLANAELTLAYGVGRAPAATGWGELRIQLDDPLEEGARPVHQPLVVVDLEPDRRRHCGDEVHTAVLPQTVGGLRCVPPFLGHRQHPAILVVAQRYRELAVAARDITGFQHLHFTAHRAEQQGGCHRMGGEAQAGIDLLAGRVDC